MIRFFVLAAALLFSSAAANALDVWKSSSTTAATTNIQMLCPGRAVFHGICTDFGVASASTTIVNSSWTLSADKIGPVTTLVADQCKHYDAHFGKGLSYFKNNTAGVTILYTCY